MRERGRLAYNYVNVVWSDLKFNIILSPGTFPFPYLDLMFGSRICNNRDLELRHVFQLLVRLDAFLQSVYLLLEK